MLPLSNNSNVRWIERAMRFAAFVASPGKTIVRAIALVAMVCCHTFAAAYELEAAKLLGPPPGEKPTEVFAGFYLSDLTSVEGESERCVFEGVLTLTWQDSRQAFDASALGLKERIYQGGFQFSEVYEGWWPQLVLANESGDFSRSGNILRIAPDGRMTYIEEMDISAKSTMQLRKFPFDRQTCTAIFEVLGFDASEVQLVADSYNSGTRLEDVSVADWHLIDMATNVAEVAVLHADGRQTALSAFHVNIDVERDSGFFFRVIIAPLIMLVMLSWSVFWMSRESLGERMDVSFIGILAVITFQIVVSTQLPRIPYFTLMSAFLYVNYLMLFGSVVVNLIVGHMDKQNRQALGDRIDYYCRWIFPASYATLIGLSVLYFLS